MRYTSLRLPATVSLILALVDQTFAQVKPDLGTAASFGIVANQAITNTGASVISGSMGLYPNPRTSITGFPPGRSGTIYAANAVANQAIQDAQTAYTAAGNRPSTAQITGADLGGQTLVAGTYSSSSAVRLTGTLTLNGENNPNAVFVFQIGSTLTTASSSSVRLINGARACNVFWRIGSSATLGTGTTFNGNILARTSISLQSGVNVNGGLYALDAAVTLIGDNINAQGSCATLPTTASVSSASSTSSGTTNTISGSSVTPSVTLDGGVITAITLPGGGTATITLPGGGGTATITLPGGGVITTTIPSNPSTTSPTDLPEFPNTVPNGNFTRPTNPLTQPTRPLTQPTLPLTQPTRPLTQPTRPLTQPTRPLTQPTRPLTKPNTMTTMRESTTGSYESSNSYETANSSSSSTETGKRYSTSAPSTTKVNGNTTYPLTTGPSRPYYIESHPGTTSAPSEATTTINGIPCTTLSYYEPACTCTKTTIVPIGYTPTPAPHIDITTVHITTVSGVACTATQYYEEACDCLRTSNVPLQVVSATASIATTINGVPCVTSKYYEPACACVQTATMPVRIASVGETVPTVVTTATATAVAGVEKACTQTADVLVACMSSCMQPYLPM